MKLSLLMLIAPFCLLLSGCAVSENLINAIESGFHENDPVQVVRKVDSILFINPYLSESLSRRYEPLIEAIIRPSAVGSHENSYDTSAQITNHQDEDSLEYEASESSHPTSEVKPLPTRSIHVSELTKNIPVSSTTQHNTYVLIIGNEDYQSRQRELTAEQNVDFAENDAKVFAEYCRKTLGIPERQIRLLIDATAAEMHQGVAWLRNLADVEQGDAKLIFYYSGHGLPHEQTRESYLIPVDVTGSTLEYGLKLEDVYAELTKHPSQQVVAIIDACFSGGARNQGLVAIKGVRVRPRESAINNNLVVISSSSGNEASGVFRDKGHGYLTYFLLRKMQETKGEVTLADLSDYLRSNVRKEAALDSRIQNPQVLVSPKIIDEWEEWRLK